MMIMKLPILAFAGKLETCSLVYRTKNHKREPISTVNSTYSLLSHAVPFTIVPFSLEMVMAPILLLNLAPNCQTKIRNMSLILAPSINQSKFISQAMRNNYNILSYVGGTAIDRDDAPCQRCSRGSVVVTRDPTRPGHR